MQEAYRFVGTVAEIGSERLDRFGQRITLDKAKAQVFQQGGCALLLETDFELIGFTDDELKIWADPFENVFDVPLDAADAESKSEFIAKQQLAWATFRELRQKLVAERSTT